MTAAASKLLRGRGVIWNLAILVLGLNIWTGLLLLPAIHLSRPGPGAAVMVFLIAAPAALAAGILYAHKPTLLGLYPLMLLVPTLLSPQMAGVNVYTSWTFVLVAASFLAYFLGVPLMLHLLSPLPSPPDGKDLRAFPRSEKWTRRLRMYRWLSGLAALFPLVMLGTLYLHPGVRADLARYYPGRYAEASAFFGVLILLFWLGLFYAYFMNVMKAHIRSDPQTRYELQRLRKETLRRRPRPSFYFFVCLALILMLALVVARW